MLREAKHWYYYRSKPKVFFTMMLFAAAFTIIKALKEHQFLRLRF